MARVLMGEVSKTYAFIERNLNLVKRYLGWELVFISYSVVNALTIAFIGVTVGKDKVLFLVIGALLWGFLSVLFRETAEAVMYERWEDTIEFTFAAPIRRATYLFGNSLFAAIYGLGRSCILLVLVTMLFGLDLSNANLVGAAVVLLASSFTFIGMGLVAATLPIISLERGSQATHIFEAFLLLVSGIYYDVSVLPKWLQALSVLSPATYTLRAMRSAILDNAPLTQLLPTIGGLILSGAVMIPIGLWVFGLAENNAKRHGKLKRGG